ncbi:hypothetical protein MPTK1_Vg00510 [Marchantia polymorpha subsp. ruderalis]|uniref:Uncharacterized protein n=1 Tax=Marchantia polymorpha TaxID=3197 RepID=A0A2R6VWQ6_MARPO|nr:hypothetical protein MARPO_YB0001 [Marchantia polymorpha]BBN20537.1 hypothetical protein Mp_Vg00510 [Marchantia polymorpha subsp. ruderalis]|eukprot:PTQ26021.1 hypothetical protein MARPO_YB0001 [Marchantia polymorpha]
MAREKRPLEKDACTEGMPEGKRQRVPALASVIVEAVKMDSLQKLCSTLEPLLRRVVGEEVERVLAKLTPAKVGFRSSPKRIQGSDSRSLRLQFRNKLALPLFTGSKVEGEQGSPIHVVLQDASSGQVVTGGVEASAKLEVVVLEGDFSADDEEDWSQEDFENHEVRERDGKRPLLTGDLFVNLKEGVGTLGELTFTDNSSWIRSRKFRLGVKISSGHCEGLRIREAKTEAFTVKDHRGELYKKHYPPALHDEVWRLDKIGKDGAFHKRLNQSDIQTVEDFLRLVVMDPQKLRNILGNGMSNKMWEGTVEHAKTCVLSGKLHVYYADDKQNIGVIFNNIFQLMGLIADGQYMSVDSLSDSEKVYVDKLVKVAYENWENVVEYDGEALIGVKPHKLRGIDAHTEDPIVHPGSSGHQSLSNASIQNVVSSPQMMMALQRPPSGGQIFHPPEQKVHMKYLNQVSSVAEHHGGHGVLNAGMNYPSTQSSLISVTHQNYLHGAAAPLTGLALGLPHTGIPSSPGPSIAALNSANPIPGSGTGTSDWPRFKELRGHENLSRTIQEDELFSEDELRAKSLEMLENEDMHMQIQQLLRMFNHATGEAPSNPYPTVQGDENYSFGAFSPSPDLNVGMDRARVNGRANVGWLKLKAALRWGIFIRKRAAARRAQLEELEDE